MRVKPYDFAREREDGTLVWAQQSQIVYPNEVDASKFLSKAGLLEQTKDGRRVYFKADTNSPANCALSKSGASST
jgi:hypothetical protein